MAETDIRQFLGGAAEPTIRECQAILRFLLKLSPARAEGSYQSAVKSTFLINLTGLTRSFRLRAITEDGDEGEIRIDSVGTGRYLDPIRDPPGPSTDPAITFSVQKDEHPLLDRLDCLIGNLPQHETNIQLIKAQRDAVLTALDGRYAVELCSELKRKGAAICEPLATRKIPVRRATELLEAFEATLRAKYDNLLLDGLTLACFSGLAELLKAISDQSLGQFVSCFAYVMTPAEQAPKRLLEAFLGWLMQKGRTAIVRRVGGAFFKRGEAVIKRAQDAADLFIFESELHGAAPDLAAALMLCGAVDSFETSNGRKDPIAAKIAQDSDEYIARLGHALLNAMWNARDLAPLRKHREIVAEVMHSKGRVAARMAVIELVDLFMIYPRIFKPILLGEAPIAESLASDI